MAYFVSLGWINATLEIDGSKVEVVNGKINRSYPSPIFTPTWASSGKDIHIIYGKRVDNTLQELTFSMPNTQESTTLLGRWSEKLDDNTFLSGTLREETKDGGRITWMLSDGVFSDRIDGSTGVDGDFMVKMMFAVKVSG